MTNNDDDVSGTVEVPSAWHLDWDAWQVYFSQYCKRTMQVVPVKDTMSVLRETSSC